MKVDPACHMRKKAIWLEFNQYVNKFVGSVNCTLPRKVIDEPTNVFLYWSKEELGTCKGRGFELDYTLNLNARLNVVVWFVLKIPTELHIKGNDCSNQHIEIFLENPFYQFVTIPSSAMYGNNDKGSTVSLNKF